MLLKTVISLSYLARAVFTACYSEVSPLVCAQIDNQDSNSQLLWPSTQSSSEQWRSGQLLWSVVALSSTDLVSLSPAAKVI